MLHELWDLLNFTFKEKLSNGPLFINLLGHYVMNK